MNIKQFKVRIAAVLILGIAVFFLFVDRVLAQGSSLVLLWTDTCFGLEVGEAEIWVFGDSVECRSKNVPSPNLKVAFIGDQGNGQDSIDVLQLISDEDADLVIHSGDFDYDDDPDAWDDAITVILGDDYPYFISPGNHDVYAWSGYQEKFINRMELISDAVCTGDMGVKSTCTYKGLIIVLTAPRTIGADHDEYVTDTLADDYHIWRICSFHKNQNKMQVGAKTDEARWPIYEACLAEGAIVATAHEHSYSRTYLMSSFVNQVVVHENSTLEIDEGQSFVFVSGIGGRSIRPQIESWSWMASIYTSTQNANYGALFCTFNVGGNPRQADCYFKDIDGDVPDQFTLISEIGE